MSWGADAHKKFHMVSRNGIKIRFSIPMPNQQTWPNLEATNNLLGSHCQVFHRWGRIVLHVCEPEQSTSNFNLSLFKWSAGWGQFTDWNSLLSNEPHILAKVCHVTDVLFLP